MTVTKKLMQARIELQSVELKKTGLNKFSNYSYFELEDFLPTVQVIFNKIGLCGIVSFASDLAKLTITDVEDGSFVEITSPMADAQLKGTTPVQNLGAVHTYLRRYLWVTAMEIVEHDALDSTTADVAVDVEQITKDINGAKTVAELTAVYTNAITGVKDKETIKLLKQLATTKKGELSATK